MDGGKPGECLGPARVQRRKPCRLRRRCRRPSGILIGARFRRLGRWRTAGLARFGHERACRAYRLRVGGLTIALEALGETYMSLASSLNIDPALMHRVAVIAAGTLDSLPHNGAVVTLLAVCGTSHRESYRDLFVVAVIGAVIALAAVIALGTAFGSF